MTRRVQIIANPIAGGGRARRLAPELADELRRRGIDAELFLTAGAGQARDRAAQIEPAECSAVVSVGGDGTLNEVLNGLADPGVPLTMLAMGTANVLACELGLPRRPAELAAVVEAGRTVPAAIGLANGRRFLLFTGVGLDGAMVEALERRRRGTLGKIGWLRPVLQMVARWPRHELAVETDTGETFEGASQVLVTHVHNYGGVMSMPGDMQIGDADLHVLCFRQRTRTAYFLAALRAWRGRLRAGVDVEILRARSLHIRGEPGPPFQVDGDYGGRGDVEIALDPVRANILTL